MENLKKCIVKNLIKNYKLVILIDNFNAKTQKLSYYRG